MPPQAEPPARRLDLASRRDHLVRRLYRLGWRLATRLPGWLVRLAVRTGSWVALRHDGSHVQTLRANLSVVAGRPAGPTLVRAALDSYLRAFYEVLALPGWSAQDILGRVSTVNGQALRAAYDGPGVVVALPHSGNWDLAGAWACLSGMPVTTVAERLPDAEFADFVAFREGLGMEVLSHRDPGVVGELAVAVRRRRMVCLLADRDLTGTGLPVSWAGTPTTMPAGPAMVARRTGATLLPAVCRFRGPGMEIVFGDPVPAAAGALRTDRDDPAGRRLLRRHHPRAAGRLAHAATLLHAHRWSGRDSPDPCRPDPAVPASAAPLRIGLVCPYSFEVPGGVQSHVLGLARQLREQGHRPFVLAPGDLVAAPGDLVLALARWPPPIT